MFENFETHIKADAQLTTDELQLMRSLAIEKKLRRRQYILQEGEVCRHKMFVSKGLLRTYLVKEDGAEVIMRFAPENTWTSEYVSYNSQMPTKMMIDALEDAEVIMWAKEDFERLAASIPQLRAYSELIRSRSLDSFHERMLTTLSYTNEEKYQHFVASFPDVFRRVPLHMVASYLGLSRETLSRIRHAQMRGN
jgi:CRP-like cAMP-binding protein